MVLVLAVMIADNDDDDENDGSFKARVTGWWWQLAKSKYFIPQINIFKKKWFLVTIVWVLINEVEISPLQLIYLK